MESFEDSSVLQGWFLDLEEDDECYNLGSHLQENSFDDFAAHHKSFITQEENIVQQRSESPESYTSGYSIFMPNANNGGNITRTATISFAGGFQFQEECFQAADQFEEKHLKGSDDYTKKQMNTSSSSTLLHHNNLVSGVNKGGDRERTPLSQDHILAERKRREKLNQKFIALSAILPALKKSDKASVLEEAIRYVKELQENVKHLEQARNTRSEKTVVKRRKVISSAGDDLWEQGHDCSDVDDDDKTAPEIEVMFSEKSVLIRVHSQERIPSLPTFLREIESLQLTILNSSAMPFGKTATDITLVAQMEEGFCMTTNDVVKHLQRSMNPRI